MARTTKKGNTRDAAPTNAPTKAPKKEKKQKDPFEDSSPMGLLKREAAERLGLADKIRESGWGGLSAAESGRIGALVNKMMKERNGGQTEKTAQRFPAP